MNRVLVPVTALLLFVGVSATQPSAQPASNEGAGVLIVPRFLY